MSKKTKKNHHKISTEERKKKQDRKTIIALISVPVAMILIALIIYGIYFYVSNINSDLTSVTWHSKKAYDASADEVKISKVYNNYYDDYQGSLQLKSDGTFTFWMTTGDASDGTHSGTYTYDSGTNKISAKFDSGDKATFKVVRNKDNSINHIEAPYKTYKIWFYNTK